MNNLVFPLYHIRHSYIFTEDNIISVKTDHGVFTLDNKNLKGNTLGERRLRLQEKPYTLKKVFYTLSDIVVHTHKHKVYIDSLGNIFNYTKKRRVSLQYRKIENIEIQESRLLCDCVGINKPIEIPFIPAIMPMYLGLLYFEKDYLLYELSQEKKKDSWRLI